MIALKTMLALIVVSLLGVGAALRRRATAKISKAARDRSDIDVIEGSDRGDGPTMVFRGQFPITIIPTSEVAPVTLAVGGRQHESRRLRWLMTADNLPVGQRGAFTVRRKTLLGSGSPDYGTLRLRVAPAFDKKFLVTARDIEAAEMLTTSAQQAIADIFRRGSIDTVELDPTRTLRVHAARSSSGLEQALPIANAIDALAVALRDATQSSQNR